MLRIILPVFSFIILSQAALAQDDIKQKKIILKGIIYDTKSMERVPFVHIIDITRNMGTSADDRGNFSFPAYSGDSIKLTAIGYEDYYLTVQDSLDGIWLDIRIQPRTYMLDAMDFYATDPMKGFYLKDIERDTIRMGSSEGNPGAEYWNVTPSGGSGYITAFANLFNRHHKQEKKLAEIRAEEKRKRELRQSIEREDALINKKYNKALVQHITDLEGEELEKFISVCHPSRQFILRSSEYEIALQIVNSFRDYRFDNGLEVDVSEILERARFKD